MGKLRARRTRRRAAASRGHPARKAGRRRPFCCISLRRRIRQDPAAYYRNNVGGTAHLLEAMRDCGVPHIVFSSTCATYGIPATVPITEQSPQLPINPYGATKMICERMLRESAASSRLTFIALRYFNAAGADPDGEIGECHLPETHALPRLLDVAAGESVAFTINGDDYATPDGTCIRDFIHVTDLADAHVRAVNALLAGADSEALNVGTGRGWSVRELVDSVGQVTGRSIPIRIGPRRPGDPPVLVADPALAKQRARLVTALRRDRHPGRPCLGLAPKLLQEVAARKPCIRC